MISKPTTPRDARSPSMSSILQMGPAPPTTTRVLHTAISCERVAAHTLDECTCLPTCVSGSGNLGYRLFEGCKLSRITANHVRREIHTLELGLDTHELKLEEISVTGGSNDETPITRALKFEIKERRMSFSSTSAVEKKERQNAGFSDRMTRV